MEKSFSRLQRLEINELPEGQLTNRISDEESPDNSVEQRISREISRLQELSSKHKEELQVRKEVLIQALEEDPEYQLMQQFTENELTEGYIRALYETWNETKIRKIREKHPIPVRIMGHTLFTLPGWKIKREIEEVPLQDIFRYQVITAKTFVNGYDDTALENFLGSGEQLTQDKINMIKRNYFMSCIGSTLWGYQKDHTAGLEGLVMIGADSKPMKPEDIENSTLFNKSLEMGEAANRYFGGYRTSRLSVQTNKGQMELKAYYEPERGKVVYNFFERISGDRENKWQIRQIEKKCISIDELHTFMAQLLVERGYKPKRKPE